jgi:hypothetical protein
MRWYDPLYWLDLRDRDGRPDHQKIVPFVVILAAIVLHAVGQPFAWWELVVLGAIAFGPRMYGLFLRRSSFTFGASASRTDTYTETVSRQEIVKRRDPILGFELPEGKGS